MPSEKKTLCSDLIRFTVIVKAHWKGLDGGERITSQRKDSNILTVPVS